MYSVLFLFCSLSFTSFGEGEPSFGETISPQRVSYLDLLRVNVTQVACGTMHTLFLTDHGVSPAFRDNYEEYRLVYR